MRDWLVATMAIGEDTGRPLLWAGPVVVAGAWISVGVTPGADACVLEVKPSPAIPWKPGATSEDAPGCRKRGEKLVGKAVRVVETSDISVGTSSPPVSKLSRCAVNAMNGNSPGSMVVFTGTIKIGVSVELAPDVVFTGTRIIAVVMAVLRAGSGKVVVVLYESATCEKRYQRCESAFR